MKNSTSITKTLYNNVRKAPPGTVYTFDELSDIAGINIIKQRIYITHINRMLLKGDEPLTLVNVRRVGYKLTNKLSTVEETQVQIKSPLKAIREEIEKLKNYNTSKHTPESIKKYILLLTRAIEIEQTLKRRKKSGKRWTKKYREIVYDFHFRVHHFITNDQYY
jgi:predicted ribosome quality control (RQC) complex YloA/Tae2 family protein